MKRLIVGSSTAAAMAVVFTVSAQGAQTPPATSMNDVTDPGARQVTVEGCVMAEDQVAGRDPNFMERAGIGEDYILTNARISSDVSGSSAVSGPDNRDAQTAVSDADESARAGGSVVQDPSGSDANRSASASSPDAADQGRQDAGAGAPAGLPDTMFELEGIDDEQLQQHVGQRVRIEGSLENLDQVRSREGGDDEAGEAADDLAELEVDTITAIPGGSCAG